MAWASRGRVRTDIDQGYRIVPDVIDADEVMQLLRSLDGPDLPRSRAGARHLMGHPSVRAVALDPRLLALAAHVVGPFAVPYRATLFD